MAAPLLPQAVVPLTLVGTVCTCHIQPACHIQYGYQLDTSDTIITSSHQMAVRVSGLQQVAAEATMVVCTCRIHYMQL
jgi:hypothetical protein